MSAFSMVKLEITVNVFQRLVKAALIGPVGDIFRKVFYLLFTMGHFFIT